MQLRHWTSLLKDTTCKLSVVSKPGGWCKDDRWSQKSIEKYHPCYRDTLLRRTVVQCVWHKKKHEMHVENFGHCVFHTMSACLPNWIFPQLLFFPLHPAFPPLLPTASKFPGKMGQTIFLCHRVFHRRQISIIWLWVFRLWRFPCKRFPQLSLTHLVTWCWLPPLLNGLKIGWKARKQFLTSFPRPLVHRHTNYHCRPSKLPSVQNIIFFIPNNKTFSFRSKVPQL